VSDDVGKAAFVQLMRSEIYGEPEPSHIITIARQITQKRRESEHQNDWISKAPKFLGTRYSSTGDGYQATHEFQAFLDHDQLKRYRAKDLQGRIFSVQNPESWSWNVDVEGRLTFSRPEPILIETPDFEPLRKDRKSRPDTDSRANY